MDAFEFLQEWYLVIIATIVLFVIVITVVTAVVNGRTVRDAVKDGIDEIRARDDIRLGFLDLMSRLPEQYRKVLFAIVSVGDTATDLTIDDLDDEVIDVLIEWIDEWKAANEPTDVPGIPPTG